MEGKSAALEERIASMQEMGAVLEREEALRQLKSAREERATLEDEFSEVAVTLSGEDEELVRKLLALVAKNEGLKRQEAEFKAKCMVELKVLREGNDKLRESLGSKREGVAEDYEKETARAKALLGELRMRLAEKSRSVGILERRVDDVPSSFELSQYQVRFYPLRK